MAWARNGTPNTLESAGANVQITDLTAKKFNQFLSHTLFSTNAARDLTFNADSSSVYATRYSYNGGADATATSTSFVDLRGNANSEEFHVIYTCSFSGQEKLSISFMSEGNAGGAGSAPNRREDVFKYVPSPDADITQIKFNKGSFTNYDTGSNLTALNGDTTEETILANVQSGSRFEATDTRKIYYGATPTATLEHDFPSSTGWSYEGTAGKMSISGNKLSFTTSASGIDARYFYNIGTSITGDFVLDYKMNLTTTSYNTIGQAINFRFGLSNGGTGYSGETPTSAHVTSSISGYHTGSYMYNYFLSHNGSTTTNTYDTDVWTIPTSTTQTYYARISRSGSTLELKFFEDANRTTQIGATKTLTSSATYNYLWAKVFSQSTTNTYEGYVEDVKLYNGVSSTDFTWTEEA